MAWPLRATAALAALAGLLAAACEDARTRQERAGLEPVYDEKTGALGQLKYDSNKNGRADTVSYMDGARIVRIEIDRDEDGTVDRWEHYGPDQKLLKVGVSRAGDGVEDAWSYAGADGAIARVEISTARDGKVTRTEWYEQDALVRAEEDADGDGRVDKWEAYAAGRLASVAFDTAGRGTPDRRLVYADGGGARLEFDPDGDGTFVGSPVP